MGDAISFEFDGASDGSRGTAEANGEQPGASGTNANGTGTTNATRDATAIPPAEKKRDGRGRPKLPRDEFGNIIRDAAGTGTGTGPAAQKGKSKAGMAVGFTPNDRTQVFQQIHGLHGAAALLTKQPVMMLSPDEAQALTKALCDVLDSHEINLTQAGGRGGLYVALALTVYSIYAPRLKAIKQNASMRNVSPPKATSVSEATTEVTPNGFAMDFTADNIQ